MAAYFKASQLMKGCHLPLLYIGLECGLTNNLKLADKFFQQAQSIAPDDPFVIHKTAAISFYNLEYACSTIIYCTCWLFIITKKNFSSFKSAEKQFREALKKIKTERQDIILPNNWEALLNNLGHTRQNLKKYEEALDCHQQVLFKFN